MSLCLCSYGKLDQIHNLYLDFTLRCERVEVLADITESVLTMARNGIAYVYLINMALNEGLSVSEFLLYFTAVTTFTTWVMGIMQEMSTLHKESLDISCVREFLEYPEPFKLIDQFFCLSIPHIFETPAAIQLCPKYSVQLSVHIPRIQRFFPGILPKGLITSGISLPHTMIDPCIIIIYHGDDRSAAACCRS